MNRILERFIKLIGKENKKISDSLKVILKLTLDIRELIMKKKEGFRWLLWNFF